MKRFNLPMIIGIFILSLILLVILFPNKITKVNPYLMESTKKINVASTIKLEGAPFPPSSENILGTDELGRDIFSFLIHGTKLTVFLALMVVLGRFLVAIPMGLSSGFGSYTSRAVINQFNGIFSAIPALIISAMILRMDFFTSLFKGESIMAFVVVLTFVGWSRIALVISERVGDIMSKPFIRGEIAIGKSRLQIALQNVVPHLAAELVVLFFMEMALALTIIMQLAIFGVFIGNLRIVTDSGSSGYSFAAISFEPEWAGMIATGRDYLRSGPWIILSPAIAFFITILGFNFLGEGLREKLQRKDSRFIVGVRRLLSLDRRLLASRGVKVAASVALLLIFAVGGIRVLGANRIKFSLRTAQELFKGNFEKQVVIGSKEAEKTASALAASLKEIGLMPLKPEMGYIMEFGRGEVSTSLGSSLEIISGNSKITFTQGKDYSAGSFGDFDVEAPLYNGVDLNLFSVRDYTPFKDSFLLLDSSPYSSKARDYFSSKLLKESGVRGLIWILSPDEELQKSAGSLKEDKPIIYIKREASAIIKGREAKLRYSMRSQTYSGKGRNVLGILKGQNEKLSNEAIIIGTGYNYLSEDSEEGKQRILLALELARKLRAMKENRNRSIIFAFWDGNIRDELNGAVEYAKHTVYPMEKSVLYIDITKLETLKAGRVYINTDQAPFSKYFGWIFGHNLETSLKEGGYEVVRYRNPRDAEEIVREGVRADEALYYRASIPTVIVKLDGKESGSGNPITLEGLGELLYDAITQNTY